MQQTQAAVQQRKRNLQDYLLSKLLSWEEEDPD